MVKDKAASTIKKVVVSENKVEETKILVSELKTDLEKKPVKSNSKVENIKLEKIQKSVKDEVKSKIKKPLNKKTEGSTEDKNPKSTIKPNKDQGVEKKEIPILEQKTETKDESRSNFVESSRGELSGNPMLKPLIEKVTINMSVGKSGSPLEQAMTIIKQLTDQKPSKRKAKKTIREFGIRKGESIACLVILRGANAEEFLKKAFNAVENKLSKYCFDRQGNFSFGIKEHINIHGIKYVPELGIHGMDISVSLGRAGYRVKRRHRQRSKIGKYHLLTSEEAILFIKDEFDVEIA